MRRMYLLDSHKLAYWPHEVSDLLLGHDVIPLTVEIGLTSSCNQRCVFCAFDYQKKAEHLSITCIRNFLDSTAFLPRSVVLSGDGEPTLHPEFKAIVGMLHEKGLSLGLMTNGMLPFIKDLLEAFTWVRFSINANNGDIYKELHGVDAAPLVWETVQKCVEEKRKRDLKTTIGIQCLLLKRNYKEYAVLAGRAAEIGADYVSFKPYSRHPQSLHSIDPQYETWNFRRLHNRLDKHAKKIFIAVRHRALRTTGEKRRYSGCRAAPFFALVVSDGSIYPCAQFVGLKDWIVGNLNIQSWRSILIGDHRKDVIKRLEHLDCLTCRRPCRLDAANEYLERLTFRDEHDKFL